MIKEFNIGLDLEFYFEVHCDSMRNSLDQLHDYCDECFKDSALWILSCEVGRFMALNEVHIIDDKEYERYKNELVKVFKSYFCERGFEFFMEDLDT